MFLSIIPNCQRKHECHLVNILVDDESLQLIVQQTGTNMENYVLEIQSMIRPFQSPVRELIIGHRLHKVLWML